MTNNILSPENLGISDPDFAQTNLYWKNLPKEEGLRRKGIVLSGIQDTGLSYVVSPILNELVVRGWTAFSMAKGPADEILGIENGFNKSIDFDPFERIRRMQGAVLITGCSGTPSVEASMTYMAHQRGMLVVGVEDFPGAYTRNLKDLFVREPETRPDILSVGNQWAKQVNVEEGFPADQIIVPGFTALDTTAVLDKAKTKQEVRNQLGIPDVLTIGWFGQVGGATVDHLEVFLNGLSALNLSDYRLVARLHPYDDNPRSTYDRMFDPIRDKVVYAGRDVIKEAERVIAALDLGVNERSTTALTGASLGVPFISIAIDETNKRHNMMPGLRVGVIEDGASPLVENPAHMADVLDQVLNDQAFRRDIFSRMKNWQSDGKSALRAADAIEARIAG